MVEMCRPAVAAALGGVRVSSGGSTSNNPRDGLSSSCFLLEVCNKPASPLKPKVVVGVAAVIAVQQPPLLLVLLMVRTALPRQKPEKPLSLSGDSQFQNVVCFYSLSSLNSMCGAPDTYSISMAFSTPGPWSPATPGWSRMPEKIRMLPGLQAFRCVDCRSFGLRFRDPIFDMGFSEAGVQRPRTLI